MHDTVPVRDGAYEVAIFNPGSNSNLVSRLRVINPGDAAAEVAVTGIDDAGASPGTSVEFEIPAGDSLTLTASDLEAGAGVDGALGDGTGKWRLQVTSNEPIVAMSLLSSPTGHLTNLSTVPAIPGNEQETQVVPLFPSASDPLGRQGFVRVVNRSTEAGTVQIAAYDDSDFAYEDVTLSIGAGATVHFNSNDLELGNAAKGLSGGTGSAVVVTVPAGASRTILAAELESVGDGLSGALGDGVGKWRLQVESEEPDVVMSLLSSPTGHLTNLSTAPGGGSGFSLGEEGSP